MRQLGPANKAIENIARMTGHWETRTVKGDVAIEHTFRWAELMETARSRH